MLITKVASASLSARRARGDPIISGKLVGIAFSGCFAMAMAQHSGWWKLKRWQYGGGTGRLITISHVVGTNNVEAILDWFWGDGCPVDWGGLTDRCSQ